MKKRINYLLIFFLIIAGIALRPQASCAQYLSMAFTPFYWIYGVVNDANEGAIKANGRMVVFYQNTDTYSSKNAQTTIVGNIFALNAFLFPGDVTVHGKFYVAIPNDNPTNPAIGWGANPVEVEIPDTGYINMAGMLALARGAGPLPPTMEVLEAAPKIKIWFGNRLYQPGVYWVPPSNIPFVVEPKPEIRLEISITSPFTLAPAIEAHSISIDGKPPVALTAANIISRTYAAGTTAEQGRITSMSIKYSPIEALEPGSHEVAVTSQSSGLLGAASVSSMVATIEVMGGPLRLFGPPLTYPSPFSISKQRIVTIQYGLSADANIEIYIIAMDGTRVKRFSLDAGSEGGTAGINKVTWDGRADQGYLAGNAIYFGTIIARDENRLLGKFKLTIFD